MFYCIYNMLNMFRALLCASPGARDYIYVITAYGVRCLRCWLLEVRSRAGGYASRMRDVARLCRATCWFCWWKGVKHNCEMEACPMTYSLLWIANGVVHLISTSNSDAHQKFTCTQGVET